MKKLKIKIIESGRILSPEEFKELKGGACAYTGCNKYDNCGWFSYEYCKQPAAAYGYESNGSSITCNEGYGYASCGIGANNYTICNAGKTYKS